MVVVRINVQYHQSRRNVVHLDIFFTGARILKGRSHFTVHDMPCRLGQEHATHVAAPCRVVVTVEFFNEQLRRSVLRRGHRALAHNLLKANHLLHDLYVVDI
uniref:Uncharacterized protein n=1 Tax=Hyaloperonospora arabidopsidis (strain Emoy2) TaxID=559515 RepID=M4C021_HYAAE